ncbi:MAG: elongation factor 4 [Candidatus Parcubacteria bacterium]|nr:MAG: elongation factor 4 [Candidatus Parcubacteria bacterium]
MKKNIKNFAIIAHIDHGKSTLADRFLEITHTVSKDKLIPQYLDRLSLERERGITIKMQPVTMNYEGFILNLIDTPGHVDFSYEVSRALAAVEGAILLIDGTQGIQAQTVANLELAKNQGLKIIPAINKIDLEIDDLDGLITEIQKLTGEEEIYLISAKSGLGVEELLKAIIEKIPSPAENNLFGSKCLVFDSHFDSFKGIVAHIRVFSGTVKKFDEVFLGQAKYKFKIGEVGIFAPELKEKDCLEKGMIGYLATGIKDPGILKIGETIVSDLNIPLLPGYKEPKPNIFANIFPSEEIKFESFQDTLNKLRLTDPALSIEVVGHSVLGRGFTVGTLGLLHLEIFEQRLKQEFNTEIIITLPSVKYLVELKNGKRLEIKNPDDLPSTDKILSIQEPIITIEIFVPVVYLETVLNLVKNSRGIINDIIYGERLVKVKGEMPLDELVAGFFDNLKSVSSGYASLRWDFLSYRSADLVKLDILIAEEKESSLSRIVPKSQAEKIGRNILLKLKELLPRQEFPIKLQAAINKKIVARETVPAIYKDVAGWLYGGDRTRKEKLWQKQKLGKKKLEKIFKGKIKIPNRVLVEILKVK